MKINLLKANFIIMMMFPITTLFQTLIPPLNKIFFALLIISFIPIYFYKISFKRIAILLLTLIVISFDYIITNGHLYNTNELFYLPFCILYFVYISENYTKLKELFIKEKKFVYGVIILWSFLVFISIFFKSSWINSWGGTKYFGSLCRGVWRLVPTAVFIGSLSIVTMVFYKNKKGIFFLLLPLFCIFMSGSRTYMVIGILLFLIAWYYYVNNKTHFILSFIPICAILFFAIMNSSMIDKFTAVSYNRNSYFDPLGTLTSGRSIFWQADIKTFIDSSVIHKIMGNGFNLIYEVNLKAFDGLVWAHNDFIQCLVSHGILGLLLYLYSIIGTIKQITKGTTYKFPLLLVIVIWVFNAFFNMFYTYFCSLLSFPILLLCIKEGKRKFSLNKEGQKNEEINNKSVYLLQEN